MERPGPIKTVQIADTQYRMLHRIYEFCNDMMLEVEALEEEGNEELAEEFGRDLWELIREYNEYMGPGDLEEAH